MKALIRPLRLLAVAAIAATCVVAMLPGAVDAKPHRRAMSVKCEDKTIGGQTKWRCTYTGDRIEGNEVHLKKEREVGINLIAKSDYAHGRFALDEILLERADGKVCAFDAGKVSTPAGHKVTCPPGKYELKMAHKCAGKRPLKCSVHLSVSWLF